MFCFQETNIWQRRGDSFLSFCQKYLQNEKKYNAENYLCFSLSFPRFSNIVFLLFVSLKRLYQVGVLLLRDGASSDCVLRRRPPDIKGSFDPCISNTGLRCWMYNVV